MSDNNNDTDDDQEFESAFAEFASDGSPEGEAETPESASEPEPEPASEPEQEEADNGADKKTNDDEAQAGEGEEDAGEKSASDGDEPGDADTEGQGDENTGEEDSTDIWAKASDELKSAHNEVEKERDDWKQRYKSLEGRVPTLNRNYNRALNENEVLKRKLAAYEGDAATKPEGNGKSGVAEDPDFKALANEYPEIAAPIQKLLEKAEANQAAFSERLGQMDASQHEDHVVAQQDVLAGKHTDWQQIGADENFHNWVATQPRMIQEALRRNFDEIVDGEEAAAVIELYKQASGLTTSEPAADPQGQQPNEQGDQETPAESPESQKHKAKREMQKRSAASPTSRSSSSGGDGPPDSFESAFHYYASQDE